MLRIVSCILVGAMHGSLLLAKEGPSKVSLPLVWKVTKGLENPESAYYDASSNTIFVSSVSAEPAVKDREGWISQVSLDGKMMMERWLEGINAPKGIRVYKDKLWFTDIDEVLAVDMKTRRVVVRIAVPGAQFLNDIAIDQTGVVYVSDTLTSTIHKIENGKSSIFRDGKIYQSPNGLLVDGQTLWIAAWGLTSDLKFTTKTPGVLMSTDLSHTRASTKPVVLTKEPFAHLDGLEKMENGDFLTSDWVAGKVYRVSKSGVIKLLMEDEQGVADIGYIPKSGILLVPQMNRSELLAFKLPTD
jgi:phage tail protein X